MNVGASAPEEAGQYFSWGNTVGHTPGDGYEFSETTYNNTPGAEVSGQLPLANDAARVNMGGDWRIPTKTEIEELINNCTYLWTTQNGIAGGMFTSNINGNSIFFPAAGCIYDNELDGFGLSGSYWSSLYLDTDTSYGMTVNNEEANPNYDEIRHAGVAIRAVC